MTDDLPITILGCGVAGSWTAHHLCSMGYTQFVLFGGEPAPEYVYEKGPYPAKVRRAGSASETLAAHLLSINPHTNIETHGNFVSGQGDQHVRGIAVGSMGTIGACLAAYHVARNMQVPWISLSLPSTPGGTILITSTPYDIDPDEHLAPTILLRPDVMFAAARFVCQIHSLALARSGG